MAKGRGSGRWAKKSSRDSGPKGEQLKAEGDDDKRRRTRMDAVEIRFVVRGWVSRLEWEKNEQWVVHVVVSTSSDARKESRNVSVKSGAALAPGVSGVFGGGRSSRMGHVVDGLGKAVRMNKVWTLDVSTRQPR